VSKFKTIQWFRGTTGQHASYAGSPGEITVVTPINGEMRLHDGSKLGGWPITSGTPPTPVSDILFAGVFTLPTTSLTPPPAEGAVNDLVQYEPVGSNTVGELWCLGTDTSVYGSNFLHEYLYDFPTPPRPLALGVNYLTFIGVSRQTWTGAANPLFTPAYGNVVVALNEPQGTDPETSTPDDRNRVRFSVSGEYTWTETGLTNPGPKYTYPPVIIQVLVIKG
jgi:hypothetical protein